LSDSVHLLMVEDFADDAELLLHALASGGLHVRHEIVSDADAMRAALERQKWDVITSDHSMPAFSAPQALALAQALQPRTPFIIVSGQIDLNLAVSLMKDGARDYVRKGELARLAPTIRRSIEDAKRQLRNADVEEALRDSEIRYRRLFEAAKDGILILDAGTGAIQDVNPYLLYMLGYSKAEFLGRKIWEIGVWVDIEASKSAFSELQAKGYVRYEDLPLQCKDGRIMPVEFVSNVYQVGDRRVAQCNIRDISQRMHTETEFKRLNADLEQRVIERTTQLDVMARELQTFNYSVSHDLRAPLRRILGFADALHDSVVSGNPQDFLLFIERIRESAKRMSALIEALLQLAGLATREVRTTTVDLSALTRRLAAELQEADPGRSVDFVVADGATVVGDELLLTIILENLLRNAWKFSSHRAHARIEFGIDAQADAFFVRDNGAGFDMDFADKLFRPFQRLHRDSEFAGLGIGLATVQRAAQRLGGHAWAEGQVDKGATFHFTLAPPRRLSLNSAAPRGASMLA